MSSPVHLLGLLLAYIGLIVVTICGSALLAKVCLGGMPAGKGADRALAGIVSVLFASQLFFAEIVEGDACRTHVLELLALLAEIFCLQGLFLSGQGPVFSAALGFVTLAIIYSSLPLDSIFETLGVSFGAGMVVIGLLLRSCFCLARGRSTIFSAVLTAAFIVEFSVAGYLALYPISLVGRSLELVSKAVLCVLLTLLALTSGGPSSRSMLPSSIFCFFHSQHSDSMAQLEEEMDTLLTLAAVSPPTSPPRNRNTGNTAVTPSSPRRFRASAEGGPRSPAAILAV
jgi:hypothetical protein